MSDTRSWRTPTVILLSGSMIVLLTLGSRNAFGLYLQPISEVLGTGRTAFGLALAIQNLVWGVTQPFAGAIADRWGSGRVVAAGGLLYGCGVLMMSQTAEPWMLHLSVGVMVGAGLGGASLAVVLAAVARAFPEERRSWALGVGTGLGALGHVTVAQASGFMIDAFGWSMSLVVVASVSFLIVPLAMVIAGRPPGQAAGLPAQGFREALVEARDHSGYRYLTLGFFVCGFHVTFIATHMPAYLTDLGFSVTEGATALSLVGAANVVGSFLAGYLGGKFSKKYILSLLYLARAVIITVFILLPPSIYTVYAFAASMGLLWLSTVPLTSALVAQLFGPRYMATLFGIVFFSHQVGAFLGAWLGGLLYDETGSYSVIWWISVALGVAAALLHWPIDEKPVVRAAPAGA